MMPEFWSSSGYRLLAPGEEGLGVTPEFIAAYLLRPELAPVEGSCGNEVALRDALIADPLLPVAEQRIAALADPDARHNYRVLIAFRDLLVERRTLEAAYLSLIRSERIGIPPLFLDQMVHAMLRHILKDCRDPLRLRAAELMFRDQSVSTDDGRVMLADEETVEMYAATGGMGGLGQLLVDSATPTRRIELDVLGDDNAAIYWQRSDRFDTVIDFRFTQPALDAFARVIEAWLAHFLEIRVRVRPLARIDDDRWTWHIGLDVEATRILNALYEGRELTLDQQAQIIALFRMEVSDRDALLPSVRGRPIYLGLAKTAAGKLKVKPQNLIVNMPLVRSG